MFNYEKLMSYNPTELGRMINSEGQEIVFLEHPTKGDEAQIIASCPALKMACYSGFYELDDMQAEHKEYEPSFNASGYWVGRFLEKETKTTNWRGRKAETRQNALS